MTYECFEDRVTPGDWRVEGLDIKTGDVEIVIFAGVRAAERARQYFFFITGENNAAPKS
jgi:hypothetical protein